MAGPANPFHVFVIAAAGVFAPPDPMASFTAVRAGIGVPALVLVLTANGVARVTYTSLELDPEPKHVDDEQACPA